MDSYTLLENSELDAPCVDLEFNLRNARIALIVSENEIIKSGTFG